jgi:transposase
MEAIAPGAVVSEVARRHDLRPQQLFGWLREARQAAVPAPVFAPVVVADAAVPTPSLGGDTPKPKPRRRRRSREGGIELEIDGVVMRVGRGAEAKTVAAVIQALKAGR